MNMTEGVVNKGYRQKKGSALHLILQKAKGHIQRRQLICQHNVVVYDIQIT